MNILITGCAGFIGYHISLSLLKKRKKIFGIDNLNNYYDTLLKKRRIQNLIKYKNFNFEKIDVSNKKKLSEIIKKKKIKYIIHLAAQAGVRFSISNPDRYFKSNILGFYNILKLSVDYKIKHLIFSSSSSVYGNINKMPLSENSNSDFPLSFYAATKKSNEVMAYSYSNIYKLPITVLRFFTVFGPYGRPDMAIYKFTKQIKDNNKIKLYNKGNHYRDFTYIDNVTQIIYKLLYLPPKKNIPYDIYNIGSGKKVKITKLKEILESLTKKKAKISFENLKKGDVFQTHANVRKIYNKIYVKKGKPLEEYLKKYVDWFDSFY